MSHLAINLAGNLVDEVICYVGIIVILYIILICNVFSFLCATILLNWGLRLHRWFFNGILNIGLRLAKLTIISKKNVSTFSEFFGITKTEAAFVDDLLPVTLVAVQADIDAIVALGFRLNMVHKFVPGFIFSIA